MNLSASALDELSVAIEAARREYLERRRRDRNFKQRFGEPQWDMLLDLFIAHSEGREVRVSSACIAAAVPISTALRHIRYLVEGGLVTRRPHPTDSRSSVLELTSLGFNTLKAHLAGAAGPRADLRDPADEPST